MTIKEGASLLFWCGALNDIAENCSKYNDITKRQVKDVQEKIESLVIKSLESTSIYNEFFKPQKP